MGSKGENLLCVLKVICVGTNMNFKLNIMPKLDMCGDQCEFPA